MALEDIQNVAKRPSSKQKTDSLLNIPLAKRIGLKLMQKSKLEGGSETVSTKTIGEIASKNNLELQLESQKVTEGLEGFSSLNLKDSDVKSVEQKQSSTEGNESTESPSIELTQENVIARKKSKKKANSRSSRRRSMNFLPPPPVDEFVSPLTSNMSIDSSKSSQAHSVAVEPTNNLLPLPIASDVLQSEVGTMSDAPQSEVTMSVECSPVKSSVLSNDDRSTPVLLSNVDDGAKLDSACILEFPENVDKNTPTADASAVLMQDIPVDTDIKDFLEGEDTIAPLKTVPKVAKSRGRRRKSADFLSVIEASAFVDSPDSIIADLPMKYTRRARKQRRMSLELFRKSKEAEEKLGLASVADDHKHVEDISGLADSETQKCNTIAEEMVDVSSVSSDQKSESSEDIVAETIVTQVRPHPVVLNSAIPIAPLAEGSMSFGSADTSSADVFLSGATQNTVISPDVLQSGDSVLTPVLTPVTDVTPSNSIIMEEEEMTTPGGGGEFDSPVLVEQSPSPSPGESPRRSSRKRRVPQPTSKAGSSRSRKRKAPETNIEDVYHNRLWREQLPKEKTWETIFEEPKRKKTGEVNLMSGQRRKCAIKFDEFYHLNDNARILQRRKKAMRMGWRPRKKKDSLAPDEDIDALLQLRIAQWESEELADDLTNCVTGTSDR